MKCNEIQELLSAYLDNELTSEEYEIISIHLNECSECRVLLQYLQEAQDIFNDIPEVEPPARIRKNVMAEINTETQGSKVTKLGNWNWKRVAASFLIFFISLATGLQPLFAMNNKQQAVPSKFMMEYNIENDNARNGATPPKTYFTASGSGVKEESDESDNVTTVTIKGITPDTGNKSADTRSADGEVKDTDTKESVPECSFVGGIKEPVTINNNELLVATTSNKVKWYHRIPQERYAISISGIVFSIIMLWYSRPKKQ